MTIIGNFAFNLYTVGYFIVAMDIDGLYSAL